MAQTKLSRCIPTLLLPDNTMTAKPLGFIQSRGLGDIIIALPIAHYYHNKGYAIHWPICEEFVSNFKDTVPWVNWIPVVTDRQGQFFYNEPMRLLSEQGVGEAICLYQSLTGHPELATRPEFQITKFDQLKYHAAQVPFIKKWTLDQCITRNKAREQALKDQFNIQGPLALVHLEGSTHRAEFDLGLIPSDHQIIEITSLTESVFDWLGLLESASIIVAVDSVFSNLVDQLQITEQVDCYFIPRSHIHLTPVLGGSWTTLDPSAEVRKQISVFKSS